MPFHLFSPIHGLAILGSLLFVYLAWWLGRFPVKPLVRQGIAWGSLLLIALIYGALTVSKLLAHEWSVEYNLPLHMCDLSAWTIVYALYTRSAKAFEAGFYWGLVGGFMALLFPNLVRLDWYFIPFFIWHAFLIAGPLYQMRADNLWPTRAGLYRSLGIAVVLGLVMMPINAFLHSNYMFLNESISSFRAMGLPEWPWYLPCVLVLALGLFWLALLGSRLLRKTLNPSH